VLVVDYPGLVRDPSAWINRIREFIGPEAVPDAAAMIVQVDPSLHRNR
jgi:hypothetical protein